MSARNRTYRPAAQTTAAARPSSDGGWRVVFPPAAGTDAHRRPETTRVAPFTHLHIGSFANYSLFTIHYSLGLSVDPMSGKYPSLSPYVYCADNPVKLVDWNGEEVINGYLNSINSAKKNKIEAKGNLEKKTKGTDEYKAGKEQLRAAKRDLRQAKHDFKIVQSAINEVRKYSKSFFDEINNLKDEHGIAVDVYVLLDDLGPSCSGKCDINHKRGFFCSMEKLIPASNVIVYLNPNAITSTGYVDLGATLAHEFGHIGYEVPNWKKYSAWLEKKGYNSDYDGHDSDDESGMAADKAEDVHKKNRKGY